MSGTDVLNSLSPGTLLPKLPESMNWQQMRYHSNVDNGNDTLATSEYAQF